MTCSYIKIILLGALLMRKAQKFKRELYFKKEAEIKN